jgi:AraC family transcriptional regulator
MNPQEISRATYTARINKVMDYVDSHLDEPIRLDTMAEIAHFSPFHFHRIFTLLVNETPADFLLRLRIERAAQYLKDQTQKPISEIAVDCGFNSTAQFSRSFRKQFGLSATQYRETPKPLLVNNGIYYSKNDQRLSKKPQVKVGLNPEFCSVNFKPLIFMETTINIQERPEMHVIYCRHTGAFDQIGNAYEKLMRWAGPRGLIGPNTHGISVYHDDPSVTAIEKVRQSACIQAPADVKVDGEIGKMVIPAGKYAVGHFEIQAHEFEQAWNTVCLWFTESGYEPGDGTTYEYYYNNHSGKPDHRFVLDICIPVRSL